MTLLTAGARRHFDSCSATWPISSNVTKLYHFFFRLLAFCLNNKEPHEKAFVNNDFLEVIKAETVCRALCVWMCSQVSELLSVNLNLFLGLLKRRWTKFHTNVWTVEITTMWFLELSRVRQTITYVGFPMSPCIHLSQWNPIVKSVQ